MASSAILQNFVDLSEPKEKIRVGAACGLKRAFQATAEGKPKDGSEEGLTYALKRLTRGVTSSRLCSQQGFGLALSEILESHPDRLQGVVQMVKSNCELQKGLRPTEHKDRLVGRMVSYAAILSAGSLQLLSSEGKGVKSKAGAPLLNEFGRGLKEVFEHRNFLKESAAAMLLHICQELCTLSRQAWVPELLGEWNLDRMVGKEGERPAEEVQLKGLVLELRLLYESATLATNASSKALAAWPSCVRTGSQLMEVDGLVALATALAKHYRQLNLGDATPRALQTLCKALMTPAGAKALPEVLDALDWHFFHPAFPKEQTRALRGLGDLISGLCAARVDSKVETSDLVLTEFFTRMTHGMKLMMRAVTFSKWSQNEAAVYAQQRMLIAIGGDPMPVPIFYGKNVASEMGEAMQKMTAMKAAAPPPWPLKDETRMALYAIVQKHTSQANVTMAGKFQKLWDRGLLATMSKEGVRSFCARLLSQKDDDPDSASEKVQWVQKGMLVLHREAPDEVLMAMLCHFITVAYFAPAKEEGEAASKQKTLREFCSYAKMELKKEGEDLPIPFCEAEVEDASFVRGKFWSLVSTLFRRTLPETSVRVIAAGLANSAGETDTESVVSTAPSTFSGGQPVKTYAFQGLLNDGSMLITRLHQFWDFLLEGCAEKTPKKKKKSASGDAKVAGGMRCLLPLSEADKELRRRCMEMSKLLSSEMHDDSELLRERQKNGINGFIMALLMALVTSDSEEEKKNLRRPIKELLEQAEKVVPAEGKELTEAKLHEALSPIPRLAAELYTETTGLVKEGAFSAWRELGDFITDETIRSLCAAVQDKEPEGEEEPDVDEDKEGEEEEPEEEDEEEPEEEEGDKMADARGSLAQQMMADGDDAAEIELDADALWSELIDDGQSDAGAGGALASAFGGANLENELARPPMKSWQRDINEKHEDAAQKFQELDLLEIFLRRAGERRKFAFEIMLELHQALIAASEKATKFHKTGSKKSNKGNRKFKAELATAGVQTALSEKIAKVMTKTLRKVRKQMQVTQASTWYTPEEWEQKARELNTKSAGAAFATKEAAEVGGTLLHLVCLVHRACKNDCSKIGNDEGWELAREFLSGTLDSWDGKKVNEKWCQGLFKIFAGRTPIILYSMPWLKHLRKPSTHFVLRSRIKWMNQHLVRTAASLCGAIEKKEAAFLIEFAELCADLFEKTLEDKDIVAAHKKQWRQALLESLKHITRAHRMRGPLPELEPGGKTAEHIAAAVIKVRDTLTSRVGAVYQGCLHVLRVGLKREDAKPAFKLEKPAKRPRPAEAEEQPAAASGAKRKLQEEQPAAASGAKRKVQKQQQQGLELSEGIKDL